MEENPNKLKVGIMDKGWYSTIEINPNNKIDINKIIEEYLEQVRKKIHVDLQVTYQARENYYTHKNFKVEDFDKAVEFLQSKDKSKYYKCINPECDFIYEIPNNFIINQAMEFTCPICKTKVFLTEETPIEKPLNHKNIGKPMGI